MPFIQANDIDIHYEIGGTGPRVLFISGTGSNLRLKPNVFDSPLAAAHEILTFDQRGLGQTRAPAVAYSMADYAEDAAALLRALQWEPVAVMGVSFGGMVAQELALRYPELVSKLALACTSSGGAGGASFPLEEIDSLPVAEQFAKRLVLADLRRDEVWRNANPERWEGLLEIARASRRDDRDIEGARRQLVARAGHDTWQRLPQLAMPVLLTGGEYDGIAPPANMTAIAQQVEQAQLQFFDGGHLFLIQDKTAYPFIIEWLAD